MIGFLGKLFGSDRAIEKGIDTISQGLDKLVYTNEEKATDAMKERAEARAMIIDWMKNTQGQNLARRLLAMVITVVWLTMYGLSTLLNMVTIWVTSPEHIAQLEMSADEIGNRAMEMNGAMMLILGFYFAAPHLGSIVGGALDKFTGNRVG